MHNPSQMRLASSSGCFELLKGGKEERALSCWNRNIDGVQKKIENAKKSERGEREFADAILNKGNSALKPTFKVVPPLRTRLQDFSVEARNSTSVTRS